MTTIGRTTGWNMALIRKPSSLKLPLLEVWAPLFPLIPASVSPETIYGKFEGFFMRTIVRRRRGRRTTTAWGIRTSTKPVFFFLLRSLKSIKVTWSQMAFILHYMVSQVLHLTCKKNMDWICLSWPNKPLHQELLSAEAKPFFFQSDLEVARSRPSKREHVIVQNSHWFARANFDFVPIIHFSPLLLLALQLILTGQGSCWLSNDPKMDLRHFWNRCLSAVASLTPRSAS